MYNSVERSAYSHSQDDSAQLQRLLRQSSLIPRQILQFGRIVFCINKIAVIINMLFSHRIKNSQLGRIYLISMARKLDSYCSTLWITACYRPFAAKEPSCTCGPLIIYILNLNYDEFIHIADLPYTLFINLILLILMQKISYFFTNSLD